jgi:hypothetical protein
MIGGHAIFCDDIRQEVGNKSTYIGIYKSALIVEGPLPAILPKLGVVLFWSQTLDEELLPVELEVIVPGYSEPVQRHIFDPRQVAVTSSSLTPEERVLYMEFPVLFSPIELKQAGDIRVVAIRAGKRVHIRRLDVRSNADAKADIKPT